MGRPVVRALIARVEGNRLGRTRLVDLRTAYIAVRSGLFACVGPDPEDEIALAKWQREQEPRPKWHRP